MCRFSHRRAATISRCMLLALATVSLCACRSLPGHNAGPVASVAPASDTATSTPRAGENAHLSLSDAAETHGGRGISANPVSDIAPVGYLEGTQTAYEGESELGEPVPMQSFAPPGYGSFPGPAPYNTGFTGGNGMLPQYAAAPGACGAPGCSTCSPGCPPPSWRPPGMGGGVWPQNEYLCDGSDRQPGVKVDYDFTVRGLQAEDTVVHFDTVDGRVMVEPSNCVCIYAPRFASVRKVSSPLAHEERLLPGGVDAPVRLWQDIELGVASTVLQPIEPVQEIGADGVVIFRERLRGVGLEHIDELYQYIGDLLPYEDFQLIRYGVMLNSEKARLAEISEAAIAWTHNDAVQVIIDETEVAIERDAVLPGDVTTYDHQGNPQMRICKLASACDARPGEIVEFTLRFDNVGNEPVGNVTILDNLTTRLEYVPESTTCTLDAEFFATENEGESLILRWEILDPLPAGAGGVIHFKCRVR